MADTATPSKGFSSLAARIVVALIAIPAILWMVIQGGYAFFAFVALISTISLYEFYKMAEKRGAAPLKLVGILFGVLINFAFVYERAQVELYQWLMSMDVRIAMFSQLQFLLVLILKFLLIVLLLELFRKKGSPLMNIGSTVLGVLIISLFFGTLIAIRELFPYGFPAYKFFTGGGMTSKENLALINQWGGYTVAALLISIWLCDTAAYFGGVTFGKRKLFERVSPKKTWEGTVFGFVFAVATMVVAQQYFINYLSLKDALIIGSFVGVFGQVGDLVESRFKREADVKDSSALIPGHGGVYDRFDSLVFVSPIVYLYIDFVVLS
ncbi:MAG: phosphatidate cytidylyltransferase [Ignavibacteriae bacterium]|nr:phosphatidate cytidylyltransferase [Ignavibacteriota bacterium]